MKGLQIKKALRIAVFCLICGVVCVGFLLLSNMISDSVSASNSSDPPAAPSGSQGQPTSLKELPKVYMTTEITPAGLDAVYRALGRKLTGKVAVKLSTGEPGGHYYLSPSLIKNLVKSVNGTIVECNTAYGGGRASTDIHKQVAKDHGFTAIAPVDIMDEEGSISLPFTYGKHIKADYVGSHFVKYDSVMVLSHFKGHEMGGFGGAFKNMSIGIASAGGKVWIHSAGKSKNTADFFSVAFQTPQDDFLESMAEAAGAVMNKMGKHILYINVMNNLSIDCDCNGNPAPPRMKDIGILASLDPVALDKACVDRVYAADPKASKTLREQMESKNAVHLLDYAETLGLGSRKYQLVMLK